MLQPICAGILGVVVAVSGLAMAEAAQADANASPALAGQILQVAGIHGGPHRTSRLRRRHIDSRLTIRRVVSGARAGRRRSQRGNGAHIRSLGLYGTVSVEQFNARRLPYADNTVNLLVVEDRGQVADAELQRILVPRGVAYVRAGRGPNLRHRPKEAPAAWTKTVKPWPAEIDGWTHWLHDASGNAVAHGTARGAARRMQWVAEPLWSRGHEVISSVGAVVTADGRIVYVVDEATTAVYTVPSQWKLVARDAFNGVLLWKRPLPDWGPPVSLGGFTSGFRPRRLVTDGQRIYLPMGDKDTLTAAWISPAARP